VVRYSFTVRDLHSLHLAGLSRRFSLCFPPVFPPMFSCQPHAEFEALSWIACRYTYWQRQTPECRMVALASNSAGPPGSANNFRSLTENAATFPAAPLSLAFLGTYDRRPAHANRAKADSAHPEVSGAVTRNKQRFAFRGQCDYPVLFKPGAAPPPAVGGPSEAHRHYVNV